MNNEQPEGVRAGTQRAMSKGSERSEPRIDPHFVGTKEPMWELNSEQAWHKVAAVIFASGKSAREVARLMDRSEPAVQNLTRQKWFQAQVTEMIVELGGSRDIMKLVQGEQFNSLNTLVEMRDNPRVPSASRIQCARDILDRGLGKPTQRIEMSHEVHSDDPVSEVEKLEQENDRLRNEQERSCCERSRNSAFTGE